MHWLHTVITPPGLFLGTGTLGKLWRLCPGRPAGSDGRGSQPETCCSGCPRGRGGLWAWGCWDSPKVWIKPPGSALRQGDQKGLAQGALSLYVNVPHFCYPNWFANSPPPVPLISSCPGTFSLPRFPISPWSLAPPSVFPHWVVYPGPAMLLPLALSPLVPGPLSAPCHPHTLDPPVLLALRPFTLWAINSRGTLCEGPLPPLYCWWRTQQRSGGELCVVLWAQPSSVGRRLSAGVGTATAASSGTPSRRMQQPPTTTGRQCQRPVGPGGVGCLREPGDHSAGGDWRMWSFFERKRDGGRCLQCLRDN